MLIEKDLVAVRVDRDKARRPGGALVRLLLQLHALRLQLALESRISVNEASVWALLSQPGLKVRMFFSNMP